MPRIAGALGDAVAVTHTAGKQKPRRWPVGLAWALWAVTVLSLPVVVWLYQLLRKLSSRVRHPSVISSV
jgi:hypothetical protein